MGYRRRRTFHFAAPVPQSYTDKASQRVGQITEYKYKSIEDFMRFVLAEEVFEGAHSLSSGKFYGNMTFDEAVEKIKTGCAETSKKMKTLYNDINATSAKVLKPELTFMDEGLFFDTATFLEGTPEYWIGEELTQVEARGSKGVVRIYANISSQCSVEDWQYLKRGANIAQAVETLEISGYATEIIACAGFGQYGGNDIGNGQRHNCYITIKEPDQMLDFDKLAFIIGNITFFRRIMFRWLERLPEDARNVLAVSASGYYAYPANVPNEEGIFLTRASYGMSQNEWKKILSQYVTFEEVA